MSNGMPAVELEAQTAAPEDAGMPQAHEAEQAALGGLLLAESKEILNEIGEILNADDFFHPRHKIIYQAFLERSEEAETVDVVTVAEALTRENRLESAGGLAYLQELADNTPMVDLESLLAYAGIVRDAAMRRRLIAASRQISNSCFRPEGMNWEELLDRAEHRILHLSEEHEQQDGPRPMQEVLSDTLSAIQKLCDEDRELTGLRTGFPRLDKITSGLQKSDLIILAGRPSTGKTALAMNIVQQAVAAAPDQPVAVFSIEMSDIALTQRLLSSESGVPLFRIRNGHLNREELNRLESALERLRNRPFFLDTSTILSPISVRRRLRRIASRLKQPPALVVVDYLQLMSASPGVRYENRNLEVAHISREMKALAKEFECPTLLLSQLNRGADRASRAPNLADLRDSGAIEQDADLVLLLHPEAEAAQPGEEDLSLPREISRYDKEIILNIAKHRNGPVGKNHLILRGETVRFEEQERPEFQDDDAALS